jgi:hypothetical protein
MDLLQWWNLIFVLPAFAALLYLLLLALGALPVEGGDLDADADLDHDVDHDTGNLFHGALNLVGVGRVPLSLILMSFFFLWGFFGWLGNQLFAAILPSPTLFIWPSLLLALVGAGVLTRTLAAALGRVMPATESYGADARGLLGRVADVRYPLTERSGSVQIYDQHGSLHEVPARVLPGEREIAAGERVVLWRFDEQSGSYFAVQDDALSELVPGGSGRRRASLR